MLKTKLFSNTDPECFETTLNEFIKDKEVVDIHYRTFSIQTEWQNGMPTKGEIVDRALVVYREAEKKKEEPNDDIKRAHWLKLIDFNGDKMIKCASCGCTLNFSLLGEIFPTSCPFCGALTKNDI